MGKCGVVIKYALIVYNMVVAILGTAALIGTIYLTAMISGVGWGEAGLIWPWLNTFAIFSLSALGMYGAYEEKKTQLIVFCVQMGIITVYMVTYTISLTVIAVKISAMRYQRQELSSEFPTFTLNVETGILWGLSAFGFLGALLSGLMVRHIKNRRSLVGSRRSIPPGLL